MAGASKAKAKAKAKAKVQGSAKAKAKGKTLRKPAAAAEEEGAEAEADEEMPEAPAPALVKRPAGAELAAEEAPSPALAKRPACADSAVEEALAGAPPAADASPASRAEEPGAGAADAASLQQPGKSRFIQKPPSGGFTAPSGRASLGSPAGGLPAGASVLPFAVVLLIYNDHEGGTLQYKSLGTFPSSDSANARVGREFSKWREEDARPACEGAVRHLDGEERAAELKRLVQKCIVVGKRRGPDALLSMTASIRGLDVAGSSNHWRWQALPSSVEAPVAARVFCAEMQDSGASGQLPEPYPLV